MANDKCCARLCEEHDRSVDAAHNGADDTDLGSGDLGPGVGGVEAG